MHTGRGEISRLLLILSGFFLPLNIYVIGDRMGAGVQFALFRILLVNSWSYLSLFRDVEYAVRGIYSGRTGVGILIWAAAATLLASALFLYLFREDVWGFGDGDDRRAFLKYTGVSLILSGVLFLISIMIQYGPFFHGPLGFTIPLGLPLIFCGGYSIYRESFGPGSLPRQKGADTRESWRCPQRSPRTVLALVCFASIFLTVNQILSMYNEAGGDFITYCTAVDLWSHQGSPYDTESFSLASLPYRYFTNPFIPPFVYPPATIVLFVPICAALHLVYPFKIHFLAYLLVFLMSCHITGRCHLPKKDWLLLSTLLTSGFATLYWSFSTGNIAILYLLASSLVFYFYTKKRYYLSSLWIGFMSLFNIFPIIFSSLYVFSGSSRRERLKIILLPVIVLGMSLVISSLAYPALFASYVNQLTGEGSPIHEAGGLWTPTAYLFFQDLAGLVIGRDSYAPYVLDLFFIALVLSGLYSFFRRNRNNSLGLFAFGLMAIFLLIPRLKPNYFLLILIPVYLLIVDENENSKIMVITIGALLPSIAVIIARYMPLEHMKGDLVSLMISYNQFICAVTVFLFIAWFHWKRRENGNQLQEG